MQEPEKIGLTEWLPVVRRSRVLYLRIRDEDVRNHDIRPGDQVRVEIQVIIKGPRDRNGDKDET